MSWLVIGCSLARAAADHLSDLDLALGVNDEPGDAAERIRQIVEELGQPVESLIHRLPGVTGDLERLFVQFEDRTQVDLVIMPAAAASFSRYTVVLYDPQGLVHVAEGIASVSAIQLREWAFLACCALADVGKYLRRGSTWEALARLGAARDELWKLVAVTLDVPDARYGVTSILDFAPDHLPAVMAATVADLDPLSITAAALRLAVLLAQTRGRLLPAAQSEFPERMLAWVTADLSSIPP